MLIYHPAFDAYHCVFRMLLLTNSLKMIEYSKLRILDFYLCFPAEISKIELPKAMQSIRNVAKGARNKFRGPVSALRTFRDLEQIQNSAVRLLAASEIFDSKMLEEGIIIRSDRALPEELKRSTSTIQRQPNELTTFVLAELSKLELQGTGGLKQRTGLMEYRYDPV